MSFKDLLLQDCRYLLLKALLASAGYEASSNLLQSFLDSFGQKVSADTVLGELAWLQEQNMVELETNGNVTIAKLKPRGEDIVQGRSSHPGIRKPIVGEI